MNPTRSTRPHGGSTTASRFNPNPGSAVHRGGTAKRHARQASRISSPQQTEVTILPSFGEFIEPITWMDDVAYQAAELNRQIIKNVDRVVHPVAMLETEWDESDSAAWKPVTGFSWAIGANETWMYNVAVFTVGVTGYWYSGLDLPVGAILAGQTTHQNSNPQPEVGFWQANASSEFSNGWYQSSETVAQGVAQIEVHDLLITTTAGGTAQWFALPSQNNGVKFFVGTTAVGVRIA